MTSDTTKSDSAQPAAETAVHLFDNWFDPIEAGLRDRVREFLELMFEGELSEALSRPRYARRGLHLGFRLGPPIRIAPHCIAECFRTGWRDSRMTG